MNKSVSKAEFDAFVAANAHGDAKTERDVEYSYECYEDAQGHEIAFASFHSYKGQTYTIIDQADDQE